MKPSEVIATIRECYHDNIPLMIHGPAGAGKSDCAREACRQLGAELNDPDFGYIDFRAALRDPVDISGMPYIADGQTRYSIPAEMPLSGRGIIVCEEINMAHPQTQGALYQFILDRGIGSYRLPQGWLPIATGNRRQDAGVTHNMPDPLIDRFEHADFEIDLAEWCAWALGRNIHPWIIAFYRFRPALLHVHDKARACHAFATPRGAARCSAVLARNSVNEAARIRGNVGDAVAGEMLAFFKLCREMVSPDAILLNPLTADVPSNAGVLYALAEALARRATTKNIDAVLTYAKRMPPEYSQALVSSMTRLTPALCNTHEFIAWASAQPN